MLPDLPWPSVLALVASALLWPPGSALVTERLRALAGPGMRPPGGTAIRLSVAARNRLLAAVAGIAAAALVGGLPGCVAGGAVAFAVGRLLRRTDGERDRMLRAALLRDLPGACDLLAVCLSAGLPVSGALAAVGEAVPGPLGARLRVVAGLYRLGAGARRAWADGPPELQPLARTLVRGGESGASVVAALTSLAGETRSAARAAVEADVRRAGVWVLAPLGLCFLPAFVCLGVVPIVLGIADDVLG